MKIIPSIFLAALLAQTALAASTPEPIVPSKSGPPVRVACVGDSITFGHGTLPGKSYPSQLQALLGSRWEVKNFGVSARTLLRKGDFPYWRERAFQDAQDFQPNVVIIMLGTNDTKPLNWKFKDEFLSDYRDFVKVFQALPSHPRVFLCRPCPVPEPGNFGINDANIQIEIPWIDRLAKELGTGVIDMHAALAPTPALLPDRVHPNSAGALIMAETAATALTGRAAAPRPNSLFSDNAVLQRGVEVPVWGTAPDGEEVTVEFGGQKVAAVTAGGAWTVRLAPMKANATPQSMTISGSAGGVRTIANILVGDVWVASGQSNMERELGPRKGQKEIVGWREAAAAANYPLIRQFSVPHQLAFEPQAEANGTWTVCSPETAAGFSAVGFFFARDVFKATGVPIAILHTSWGGTPAEAWTSTPALKALPGSEEALAKAAAARTAVPDPRPLDQQRADWYEKYDLGSRKSGGWEGAAGNEVAWKSTVAPVLLSGLGLEAFDGVVWFRREFDLPAAAAGKAAIVHLGQLDDQDAVWVNGARVGATAGASRSRDYPIAPGLLEAGRNVLTIRLVDVAYEGGWTSAPEALRLEIPGQPSIPLAGPWHYRIGVALAPPVPPFPITPGPNPNLASVLYNAMIAPLLPFPITGVIWYQGEANFQQARRYRDLFPALIADWRRSWKGGDFPFLFAQLAPYKILPPELREAQFLTLARVPNTAMAVLTDVGDAEDIHPARKEPVGQRLALAARALAYGGKEEFSGPLFSSMSVSDDRAIVRFTHVGSGLVAKDGPLKGFTIAGDDGKFVAGQARIVGDTVVVHSPDVKRPTAVRYGWANVPDVNLFNREGLPASPFRTDID